MRGLIILAAIVALLAVAGWITFSSDSGHSSINLETNEIRKDTGQMLQTGSEALRDAEVELSDEPADSQPAGTAPAEQPPKTDAP